LARFFCSAPPLPPRIFRPTESRRVHRSIRATARTFPPDEHERFVSSVTHGKNQMPPWGDLLDANDIESLWAYVMAGERR
jgi:hypothetical protein